MESDRWTIDEATRWSLGLWLVAVGIPNLDVSAWKADWVQAFGSIAAILAGAAGIAWQSNRQRRHEAEVEIETEIALVADLRSFLLFADHYLGMLAGKSLDQNMYTIYIRDEYIPADLDVVTQVFNETHSRDVPGPLLKLAFKHCAAAFEAARKIASGVSYELHVRGTPPNARHCREHFVKLRDTFNANRRNFDDRLAELQGMLRQH